MKIDKIDRFDGSEYRFLSNFWSCKVEFEGAYYPSTEAAFQAAKTTVLEDRKSLREL